MCIYHISLKKTIRSVPPRSTGCPGPRSASHRLRRRHGRTRTAARRGDEGGHGGHGADCAAGTHLPEISDQNAMGIHGLYGDTMGIPWGYHD